MNTPSGFRYPVDDERRRLEKLYSGLRLRHMDQPGRRSVTAVDVQTCVYLHRRLSELGPRRVADLGSGFSTVALRAWRRDVGADVVMHTADHARRWLSATQRDLRAEALPADGCMLLDEWLDGSGEYDVIFVDFQKPAARLERFPEYVTRLAPGGLFVFDDWQFPHLRMPMTSLLRRRGFCVLPLPEETTDRHDRYIAEAWKGDRP